MDKVTEAERKLAGLCQLCGLDTNKKKELVELLPIDCNDECLYKSKTSWRQLNDKCYVKLKYFERMKWMEERGW